MIKRILLIILFLTFVGCTFLQKDIIKPISDIDYIEHYRPLFVTVIKLYQKDMSQERLSSFLQTINEMDIQVTNSEQTDIYPSMSLILDIISEKHETNKIPNEEAQIILTSLDYIKNKYINSPLMKEIYPKLKNVLQSNMV